MTSPSEQPRQNIDDELVRMLKYLRLGRLLAHWDETLEKARKGRYSSERLLKYMVWLVVICFGLVVIRTGIDFGALLRGFFAFAIPGEQNGVHGATVMLSALAAAVGINMVFLYPYTLLARGWGRAPGATPQASQGVPALRVAAARISPTGS